MALGDNPDVHWPAADIPDVELPEGYNWCELGAVTKVKNGCSGGLPENAYKTLIEIGGLETEEDYGEDKACKFNRSQVAAWRSDRTRPRWVSGCCRTAPSAWALTPTRCSSTAAAAPRPPAPRTPEAGQIRAGPPP